IDHLDRQDGEGAYGLTSQKIRKRAEAIHAHRHPGLLVFEMERHRPVLGEKHVPGNLMSAMVVGRFRYGYDSKKDEIQEMEMIGEARLDVDVDYVAEARFDEIHFSVEEGEEGKIVVEELTYGERAEVADRKEAESFAV